MKSTRILCIQRIGFWRFLVSIQSRQKKVKSLVGWWPGGVFHLRITLPVLDRLDAIKPVILITIRPCSITAAPSITV